MIKGITVTLINKTESDRDEFNNPIYTETETEVENVLVGEPTTNDVNDTLSLFGKRLAYTLGIPKGDENNWVDATVILPSPFTGTYRTIGYPTAGIEEMIPLNWNMKVKLERYG